MGRASDRDVVLSRPLRAKLVALNPGLPDAAYDDAARQIVATVATQSLIVTNREKYNFIRDGVQVAFRNAKGDRERRRLRVFDFAEPTNNDFLCVRELWVRGDLYRRRADIVGFVNGLPLLFMDLLENFIVFDDSAGEPKKILARNHQFLGVNRAIEAVRDRKGRDGKLGVFWHTQGAGKSYSMVMFTRKVHRKIGGNFTFLVLTDRDDLDTQIYKTFAGCGVVDNDRDPCRAASGEHLGSLLAQHKSHIFSLIQKFNRNVEPNQPYTERDDIIVITDEAHRTQYGTLALNLHNALPNAGYIGFTGTPLFTDDEITRRVFGNYVSTYDFQRAVDDVNERIADKLEEL
ncbi:MAG: DEAD/DEAH box helicase family protein [Desulfobacteraceae bacterium]|nr:DEAD/DEAH box helicase family protein [Desulfobacteraceae bacterium]MDD3990902.1 DEAD/DEAH box helicase family protein [Desulfobacteraceae bacterium]